MNIVDTHMDKNTRHLKMLKILITMCLINFYTSHLKQSFMSCRPMESPARYGTIRLITVHRKNINRPITIINFRPPTDLFVLVVA